ncbi:TIGR03086 family metal-binding protein [Nocardia blacklockiae]|uniref:TIGR03086 family metal-binding protein n=1 Tax=Nocardia blacklockiae TaxID=480036 RepID=UPI00189514EE|nr:TIGR03086 family metal-binding protein [Nocardia blacklockiae]MBF6173382.1 TIGR03086 family protein [Nocardia blacklockiae]
MIDLKPACHTMSDLLEGISGFQLCNPTPCVEYTVRGLVDHIAETARGATGLAGGPADLSSTDDLRAVAAQVRALGTAWDNPAAWIGTTTAGGLELSNELWGRIACTEMVVHGWDLAAALGRPFRLPEPILRACLDHVTAFVPSAPVPALWGSPVQVPADASLIDRIVAITGRNPHWVPAPVATRTR